MGLVRNLLTPSPPKIPRPPEYRAVRLTMISDSSSSISYKFGLVAMLAGLIGVPLGSFLAQRLRGRYENCDPYICAVGLFISAPMVFAALVVPQTSESLCFFFVFVAQVALNLCWSIVADILLVRW